MLNSNHFSARKQTNLPISKEVQEYLAEDNMVVISMIASKIKNLRARIYSELSESATDITIDIVDKILNRECENLKKIIDSYNLSTITTNMIQEISSLVLHGENTFLEQDMQRYGADFNNKDQKLCIQDIIKEQSYCGAMIYLNTCFDTAYPKKLYREKFCNATTNSTSKFV